MRIYVASSWRNVNHPQVVATLRSAGHEVYDFRNPSPGGGGGFAWEEIDPGWSGWTPEAFRDALEHPAAIRGFALDRDALEWCDACLLVLPCGRSAHLELGFAAGRGKLTLVLLDREPTPELMYRLNSAICVSIEEVLERLEAHGIDPFSVHDSGEELTGFMAYGHHDPAAFEIAARFAARAYLIGCYGPAPHDGWKVELEGEARQRWATFHRHDRKHGETLISAEAFSELAEEAFARFHKEPGPDRFPVTWIQAIEVES